MEDGRVIKPRKYDLNPGDFLSDIAGEMTPAELGVYWMICLLEYRHRGPIKNDMAWLRRKFRAHHGLSKVKGIVRDLIASGRVIRVADTLTVTRVEEEVERAQIRTQTYTENGSRGGRPRNDINKVEKPSGFPSRAGTPPPPPPPPERKKESALSSAKESEQARLARLAAWMPNDAHQEAASRTGHNTPWLHAQATLYRNHQPNAKTKHKDFNAGFTNWLLRAPQFEGNGHVNGRREKSPNEKLFEGFARAIAETEENWTNGGGPTQPLLDS